MKIDHSKEPSFLPVDFKQAYFDVENITKPKNNDDKLKKAAQDFEAIFVAQILRNMRRSLSESTLFGDGVSGDIYGSMFDNQIAQAIASKQGLHLSDIIIEGLNGRDQQTDPAAGLALSEYRGHAISRDFNNRSAFEWDRSIIAAAAKKHNLDPKLVESVIKVESNYRANAISRKGAVGLMQLMKATAKELGVRDRFDPRENVFGGTKYLKELIGRFNGDLELGLGAYNAGPAAVEKYGGIPPYEETQNYVQKVLKHYREM